ncbi:MAG: GNAT family N-acetyltransferase [Chloroflexota bacterium]|nr:GNAT family N-acetyltransferase [Chloroflexota bacterium]
MTRPAPLRLEPIVLEGGRVRLEPMSLEHLPGLCEAGLQPGVFRWFVDPVETAQQMRAWVERALAGRAAGTELPWVTIEQSSGAVVGSSRYMNVDPLHHRLEIGSTWLTPAHQGGGINTAVKLLQLGHAFEALGAIRVEFKTDSLNERSRGALTAIGATFEGILREHMIVADGRHRHSAYYSIVAGEWPDVRLRLEQRLLQ